MAAFKGSTFKDRAETAAAAKKALLEAFKTRPAPDDPGLLARQAARRAIVEAREAREAERRRLKEEEAARLRSEEEARRQAEAEEAANRAAEQAARDEQIRAERKAIRDARYAARKARNKR
ncbi:MAG: hypothetical protein JOZ05_25595 [Acetobacteraceae bacterium]|nr:hypothetical protein [Acetobacteraceae bacterium]